MPFETCFKGFDLLNVNVNFYTCRQIEFLEFVNGLYGWLDYIDKPFVSVIQTDPSISCRHAGNGSRCNVHSSRHWDRTSNTGSRSLGRIYDIRCGLIYDPIIEASEFNSYALSVHLVIN